MNEDNADEPRVVRTVDGDVPAATLGHTQTHEHLLCDLGAMLPATDDPDEIAHRRQSITLQNYYETRRNHDLIDDLRLDNVDTAVAELAPYHRHGGGTVVEATSVGLGRDPEGLLRIARASGVKIVMGSGYYVHQFHPSSLASRSQSEITAEIISDIADGVGPAHVRAGIIGEIGLTSPEHPDESKVLRAAVDAQRATGAALLIHPGRHVDSIFSTLEVIEQCGGDISRTIMSHIDRTIADPAVTAEVAARGAYVELDLFGQEHSHYAYSDFQVPNDGGRILHIADLIDRDMRDHVLISQDICYKTKLTTYGGEGYAHILRHILPQMRAHGLTEHDIQAMTVDNPARVLAFA